MAKRRRAQETILSLTNLLKNGAVFASIFYGIGFITVASFNQRLQIVDYTFVSVKYFYAGFYYLLFLAVFSIPLFSQKKRTHSYIFSVFAIAALSFFVYHTNSYNNFLFKTLGDLFYIRVGEVYIIQDFVYLVIFIILIQMQLPIMFTNPTTQAEIKQKNRATVLIPFLLVLSVIFFGTSVYPIHEYAGRSSSPNFRIAVESDREDIYGQTGLLFQEHFSSLIFLLDKTDNTYYFLLTNGKILAFPIDSLEAILIKP